MTLSVHPLVGMLKSLFVSKCSTSSMSFMDSVVIFYRSLMNMLIQLGYFSRGIYKLHCYVSILTVVITFFECTRIKFYLLWP